MENRNFHTALVGGFRKKDVVNFLAEDKRQQEAALQDLQTQLEEAEAQIKAMMEERDAAQEALLALRQEQESLQEELTVVQNALDDRLAADEQLRGQYAQERNEAMAKVTELEAQLEEATMRNNQLENKLQELRHAEHAGPDAQQAAVLAGELQILREQLQAERQRAEALSAKVSQPRQPAEGMDQLWNLCGKMERTLSQMERLMDGPYRMTCYPEPVEKRQEAQPSVQERPCVVTETIAEEAAVPVQEIPAVKSLLQRIRGKR